MPEPLNLLLDTHVLLWWLAGSSRLPQSARKAIDSGDAVYVSAASAWEIAIKTASGKLEFRGDLQAQLLHNRFRTLSISIRHALAAGALFPYHSDPFDRILVAQAQVESLRLVTSDSRLSAYGAQVLLV